MNTTQPPPTNTASAFAVIPGGDASYPAKPGRLAKGEVFAALEQLATMSLAEQANSARISIRIGAATTSWCRPLSQDLPAFKSVRDARQRRLLLWDADSRAVVVYDCTDAKAPRRLLRTHAAARILAELPKVMFGAPKPEQAASEAQLNALRKLLDLPAGAPLPALHMATCSQLMDRILVEPLVAGLVSDLNALRQAATAGEVGVTVAV